MLVSSHLRHLLRELQADSRSGWVMASVASKFRSSYRQPGAMMLINPDGMSFGLVSGGCLEADIRLNARKVLSSGYSKCVLYDSTEEGVEDENLAAELGLGCNGRVEILIQEVKESHRSLLLELLERMESGLDSHLLQCFKSENSADLEQLVLLDEELAPTLAAIELKAPKLNNSSSTEHQIIEQEGQTWSLNKHSHPTRLWVFGGGEDAQPVVKIAASLGWKVTLIDHRPANARKESFPYAETILRNTAEDLNQPIDAEAAIVMGHSIKLDAQWLAKLQHSKSLRYIGLLGPRDRRKEVLELASIDTTSAILPFLHGPMGFDIGGDLPESVALATLAQCHQVLFRETVE